MHLVKGFDGKCLDDRATAPPTGLVLHGTADRILPIEACGPGTHKLIPGSEYVAIDGADLGLCWTHAGEVNAELLRFFK